MIYFISNKFIVVVILPKILWYVSTIGYLWVWWSHVYHGWRCHWPDRTCEPRSPQKLPVGPEERLIGNGICFHDFVEQFHEQDVGMEVFGWEDRSTSDIFGFTWERPSQDGTCVVSWHHHKVGHHSSYELSWLTVFVGLFHRYSFSRSVSFEPWWEWFIFWGSTSSEIKKWQNFPKQSRDNTL